MLFLNLSVGILIQVPPVLFHPLLLVVWALLTKSFLVGLQFVDKC